MTLPPVVLLHAFPLDSRLWADVVELLRGRGVDAVALDFRGFGTDAGSLSDEPSLDVLSDDVASIIDDLGRGPAVIAGVSMGGYVALNLARRFPEAVAGLVLVDTKAGADAEVAVTGRFGFADRVETEGSGWVADAMIPVLLSDTTMSTKPNVEARVREQIRSCPAATIAWAQRAMAARSASLTVIEDADVPVLVIVGEDDQLSPPAEALAMAQAARRATLVEVPNAGHLTPLENPELVADALTGWLDEEFSSHEPA